MVRSIVSPTLFVFGLLAGACGDDGKVETTGSGTTDPSAGSSTTDDPTTSGSSTSSTTDASTTDATTTTTTTTTTDASTTDVSTSTDPSTSTSNSGSSSGGGELEACLGMVDPPNDPCGVCACNNCLTELQKCQMDEGCTAIRMCAQEAGCTGVGCLIPCGAVIDMYGGIGGASAMIGLELNTCIEGACPGLCGG